MCFFGTSRMVLPIPAFARKVSVLNRAFREGMLDLPCKYGWQLEVSTPQGSNSATRTAEIALSGTICQTALIGRLLSTAHPTGTGTGGWLCAFGSVMGLCKITSRVSRDSHHPTC